MRIVHPGYRLKRLGGSRDLFPLNMRILDILHMNYHLERRGRIGGRLHLVIAILILLSMTIIRILRIDHHFEKFGGSTADSLLGIAILRILQLI